MKKIKGITWLPKPIHALALMFYRSDPADPEIYEMTEDEMAKLREEDDVVFQLVFDRKYKKWYLVAVGEWERILQSEYIIHNPYRIRRSILAFTPVDEEWIRLKRKEYEDRFIYKEPKEYDEVTGRWI